MIQRMGKEDTARLHAAIVTVMRAAAEEVQRRHEPIEVKVRDFLQVRRKTICPRCGAKVRKAGVRGMDSYALKPVASAFPPALVAARGRETLIAGGASNPLFSHTTGRSFASEARFSA
jgi:hypothetical protein